MFQLFSSLPAAIVLITPSLLVLLYVLIQCITPMRGARVLLTATTWKHRTVLHKVSQVINNRNQPINKLFSALRNLMHCDDLTINYHNSSLLCSIKGIKLPNKYNEYRIPGQITFLFCLLNFVDISKSSKICQYFKKMLVLPESPQYSKDKTINLVSMRVQKRKVQFGQSCFQFKFLILYFFSTLVPLKKGKEK